MHLIAYGGNNVGIEHSVCVCVCVCGLEFGLLMGKCLQTRARMCVCVWPLAAPRQYCHDNEELLVVELDVDFFLQASCFSLSCLCISLSHTLHTARIISTKDTDE